MKIAILTSGILPVPAVQGGAVENLIDYYLDYNEIYKLHDITVFSAYHPNVKTHKALQAYKNHYVFINTSSIWFKLCKKLFSRILNKGYYDSSIELFFELSCLNIWKCSYDLLILENRPAYALKLKKRFRGTPIISHIHTNMLHEQDLLTKEIIKSTNEFFTVSQFIKKEIENVGVSTKITTIYNGIEPTLFNKGVTPIDRRLLGFDAQDFIVIFSGRLIPDKGIKELLLAFKQLENEEDIKLLVLGSENFASESKPSIFLQDLQTIAKEMGNKIHFTGFIPYQKLPHYLATANIMAIPSHINEAFGMTCIEACAMGLPVIATNDGGIPEALLGQKHIIIDKDKDLPQQLANSILHIKNNYSFFLGNELNPMFTKEEYAKSFWDKIALYKL